MEIDPAAEKSCWEPHACFQFLVLNKRFRKNLHKTPSLNFSILGPFSKINGISLDLLLLLTFMIDSIKDVDMDKIANSLSNIVYIVLSRER